MIFEFIVNSDPNEEVNLYDMSENKDGIIDMITIIRMGQSFTINTISLPIVQV